MSEPEVTAGNPDPNMTKASADPSSYDRFIFWVLFLFFLIYPIWVNPLFAPTFNLPKLTFLRLLTIAVTIVWLAKILSEGRMKFVRSPLYLPLGFFILINIVATWGSVHLLTSLFGEYSRWEGLLTTICYGILCLAALNFVRGKKDQEYLVFALLISASLVSIAAIAEHFGFNILLLGSKNYCAGGFGGPNLFEVDRSFATFGNPIYLGMFLGMTFPIAATWFFREDYSEYNRAVPFLLICSILLISTALFFTFARGAWLGTGLACAIAGALSFRLLWNRRMIIIVFLAILLLGYLLTFVPSQNTTYRVAQRVASVFKLEGSNVPRVEMWRATLPMIADRPLLGWGPDTFKLVFPKYKPSGWVTSFHNPQVDRAHNILLQTAATTGFSGVLIFLWLIITTFFVASRYFFKTSDERCKTIILALTAGAFSFFVQIQFNPSSLSVAPLFWLIMGLIFNASADSENTDSYSVRLPSSFKEAIATRTIFVFIGALGVLLVVGSLRLYIADVYFSRGLDAQHGGNLSQAEVDFEKAGKLNSSEELYLCSLARLYADCAFSQGFDRAYFDSSASLFSRSIQTNPLDENARFFAGDTYLQAGRLTKNNEYFERSIDLFKQGLELNASSSEAYLKVGVAYAYIDQDSKAIACWKHALRIDRANSPAYFNLGLVFEDRGLIEKSRIAYQKALKYDPKFKEAKQALKRLEKNPK